MSAQPVNPNLPPDHVTVFIDGVELAAPKGSMIIQAADKGGTMSVLAILLIVGKATAFLGGPLLLGVWLSPRMFNELRVGDTRRYVLRSAASLHSSASATPGLPGLPSSPSLHRCPASCSGAPTARAECVALGPPARSAESASWRAEVRRAAPLPRKWYCRGSYRQRGSAVRGD